MKRKLVLTIGAFSLLFFFGGIYITMKIESATTKVDNLIRLHRIELLREHLLLNIKRAQTDLYLKNTRYARSIDTVVAHVQKMDSTLSTCFDCHHTPGVAGKLVDLRNRVQQYKGALSRVFTIRANRSRLEAVEDVAFKMGTEIISELDDVTTMTNRKLEERTRALLKDIARTKSIIYLLFTVVPVMGVFLSVYFLRSFTRPIDALLTATRRLKAQDLDYRIEGLKEEYGEVAESFNEMASSLKEHYLRMQWAEQVVVLGELAGGLAHEMKNPIAGIKGSMEVISGISSLSEENKDVIQKVIQQIDRIESLLRNLLNFAQPPKPQFLNVNVNELLDATISLAEKHPLFLSKDSRGIRIVKDFDSRLPNTMADPIQLQQVFMNLLLNSADAIPGDGTVTVRTFHEEASPSLLITITDTGSGIHESVINKIFLPFFTTKPKGTGLGLAITRRLIEQHGGSIRVTNNPGKGTSFTIDLPINPGEVSAS